MALHEENYQKAMVALGTIGAIVAIAELIFG